MNFIDDVTIAVMQKLAEPTIEVPVAHLKKDLAEFKEIARRKDLPGDVKSKLEHLIEEDEGALEKKALLPLFSEEALNRKPGDRPTDPLGNPDIKHFGRIPEVYHNTMEALDKAPPGAPGKSKLIDRMLKFKENARKASARYYANPNRVKGFAPGHIPNESLAANAPEGSIWNHPFWDKLKDVWNSIPTTE